MPSPCVRQASQRRMRSQRREAVGRASRGRASRRVASSAFLKRFQDAFNRTTESPIDKVQTVSIGSIDRVSKMGLGTWAWGNKFLWGYDTAMDPELQQIFDYAISRGVNLFDTADSYGTGALNGRSEELLGRFVRENADVQAGAPVHIATKLAGYPWRVTPWNMTAACRGSLRRLQAEDLAVGQLHWSAAKYAPLQEWAMVNGIADCALQGLVREVGVSNYGPKQLRKVHRQLEDRGVRLASAQVQLSLLSWGPQQHELVATARELGVTVIAYSPLGLGMLTGKYSVGAGDDTALPEGPRGQLFRQILPESRDLRSLLRDIATSRGVSESQVAINWCISKGCVPIPGAKTLAMAQDNIAALSWQLSATEAAALDDAAAGVGKGMVQNIFQTA